jgi:hypothetical protein
MLLVAAQAIRVVLANILPLRTLYLRKTNFPIPYNACHERGWTDSYLLKVNGTVAGYGSISITSDVILFEDHAATAYGLPGSVFRRRRYADPVLDGEGVEPAGDYVIEER